MIYKCARADKVTTIEFIFKTNPIKYEIKIDGFSTLYMDAEYLWDMLKEDLSSLSYICGPGEDRRRFEARATYLATNLYLLDRQE